MSEGLLLFDIYPLHPTGARNSVARLSDLELSQSKGKYDLRNYEIVPVKQNVDKPRSVVYAYKLDKSGNADRIYYPIFTDEDLDNLYISASGHFIVKSSLSARQRMWMDVTAAGYKLLLGD